MLINSASKDVHPLNILSQQKSGKFVRLKLGVSTNEVQPENIEA